MRSLKELLDMMNKIYRIFHFFRNDSETGLFDLRVSGQRLGFLLAPERDVTF